MALASTLDETDWAECEAAIRRFEDAWRATGPARPDVAAYRTGPGSHAVRLLVELVHVDLEFRLRAGEFARAEDYLARFPELADPGERVELLAAEFGLRNRYGQSAWPEEFWLRFPEHLAELRARLPDARATGWFSATRPVERAGAPLPGPPVISGYEIEGELGRGGMGVVYKARDLLLHRAVAVKTFATVPRAESCARFAREAEAIARLDHPHIVPVYEVGEWRAGDGGPAVPYFAMKWYPGGSLDAAPAGPGTDPRAQARTVEAIARAVHHAHQRGVLHRDLKPSNILLDAAGRPHVADFGLAGRVEPSAATATAVVAGTPAYMAPEQARSPKSVSTAADVYGLGAILFHQLTGRAPFAADTPLATLELVAAAPPERPSAAHPAVPRDLDTICLKCLEKDPARRYASAAEVADDLERWRLGLPIAARPARFWELAWRRVRRHPVMSGLVCVTAAALVAALAVLSVSNARVRAKEGEMREAYLRECAMRRELEAALAREQQALYLERVAAAGRLYAANQLPQAWALLAQCPEQLRGWEWHYLDGLRRADAVVFHGHGAWVSRAAFLFDGRVVSGDSAGRVKVWDPARRAERGGWFVGRGLVSALAPHPKRPWVAVCNSTSLGVWDADTGARVADLSGEVWAAFNRDGTVLATGGPSAVRLWAVPAQPGGEWRATELRGHGRPTTAGAFTPDGARLVTAGLDGSVRTWDAARGELLRVRNVGGVVFGLAFADGGNLLAEAVPNAVRLVDPATGALRDRFDLPAVSQPAVASGPDPALLAVTGNGGEVAVWDVKRRVPHLLRGHTAHVAAVALGPGGRAATGGTDLTVRVWDTATRPELRALAEVGSGPGCLAVSLLGTEVAAGVRAPGPAASQRAVVLEAATGRVVNQLDGGPGVAFRPSGDLALGHPGGGVAVFDLRTGARRWAHPFPPGADARVVGTGVPCPRYSADGTRLATGDGRGGVIVWNADDGARVCHFDSGGPFAAALAFLPDGRLLVATRNGLSAWDPATGTKLDWGATAPGATALAVSVDGKLLATVDPDRAVRLRDAATGAPVRTLLQSPARVDALAFDPTGTRLVTGGADRTVRVWDTESGQELLSLLGVEAGVTAVAWSADGTRVFALDTAVRVWETRP